MNIPPTWTSLADAADLPNAVFEHFRAVLATIPENERVLRRICARARAARVDIRHDDAQYHALEIDFGTDTLQCSLPRTGDEDPSELPTSFAKILGLHGRLQLVGAQVDLFHETFIEEEGWLEGTDLAGRGVFSPLRVYADVYILPPGRRDTVRGARALLPGPRDARRRGSSAGRRRHRRRLPEARREGAEGLKAIRVNISAGIDVDRLLHGKVP